MNAEINVFPQSGNSNLELEFIESMNLERIEAHKLIDNFGILEYLPVCVPSEYVCTHRYVPTQSVTENSFSQTVTY